MAVLSVLTHLIDNMSRQVSTSLLIAMLVIKQVLKSESNNFTYIIATCTTLSHPQPEQMQKC